MQTALREHLALPRSPARTADAWLLGVRRRVFRADSSGFELDAPGSGAPPSGGPTARTSARDPLAECFAFAARWEAPASPLADDPDGPEPSAPTGC